jgi:hypothetical protein
LAVAAMGAYALLDDGDPNEYVEVRVEPFTWACDTASGIEVCLHPAYEVRLDDVTERVSRLLVPMADLPGVPTRWQQGMPTEEHFHGEPGGIGAIHAFNDHNIVQSVMNEVFHSDPGTGNYQASQLVILTALAEGAGVSEPFPWAYGMPSEIMGTMTLGGGELDFSQLDALQPTFDAAVDRFLALSPEQQRAWLEANWDALRAGTLTLDDLP